ncbi:MAG: hypothetical protein AB7K71_06190 [Polyangiaceae bacterium]
MKTREQWAAELPAVFGNRPVRWAPPELTFGDYEGRTRTLEVFNADAREQLGLLKALRPFRTELEGDVGGTVIVIFHTRKESQRLYSDFIKHHPAAR